MNTWQEEEGWDWYMVTMHNAYTDELVLPPWPVCSTGYEEAMTVFEVITRVSMR